MKFGAGRPKAHPEIYEIAPLTKADLENFTPAERSKDQGVVKRLRDSHHRIAHLYALGYRSGEVAEITGYSPSRLSTLRASPAFSELVEKYRVDVVEVRQAEADHHFQAITRLRNLAAGELIDRFEDDEERPKLTNSHLIAILADGSDRTGYPKRRESVNMNMDFASRLDRAIERSNGAKLIEGEVLPPSTSLEQTASLDGGGREPVTASSGPAPVPYRRRV